MGVCSCDSYSVEGSYQVPAGTCRATRIMYCTSCKRELRREQVTTHYPGCIRDVDAATGELIRQFYGCLTCGTAL